MELIKTRQIDDLALLSIEPARAKSGLVGPKT